jgi:hypothetical protein
LEWVGAPGAVAEKAHGLNSPGFDQLPGVFGDHGFPAGGPVFNHVIEVHLVTPTSWSIIYIKAFDGQSSLRPPDLSEADMSLATRCVILAEHSSVN